MEYSQFSCRIICFVFTGVRKFYGGPWTGNLLPEGDDVLWLGTISGNIVVQFSN